LVESDRRLEGQFHNRSEQLLLGAEEMRNEALVDAGFRGDGAQRSTAVPECTELATRGFGNGPACVAAAGAPSPGPGRYLPISSAVTPHCPPSPIPETFPSLALLVWC
jgi:hypothetical protein